MAINPSTRYPGQINAPDANYPLGSARDVVVSGDNTGTPNEKDRINDQWGVFQKLLNDAGIAASGLPDTILVSQYYEGLIAMLGRAATFVFKNTTDLANGTTILGESVTFVEFQVLKVQYTGLGVRFFVVTTSSTAPNISLGGGLYAEEVYVGSIIGSTDMKITTTYITVQSIGTCDYAINGSVVTLRIPQMVGTAVGTTLKISPDTTWPTAILAAAAGNKQPFIAVNGGWEMPGLIILPNTVSDDLEIFVADSSSLLKNTNFAGTIGVEEQFVTYHVE